ncbi:MAG: hypothetical protein J6A07_00085 [Firmicutes bacterium]|nr:hypothetical protein [Bacillota bacterium]
MKRLIFTIAVAAFLSACGNAVSDSKGGSTEAGSEKGVEVSSKEVFESISESVSESVSETAETSEITMPEGTKDINLRTDRNEILINSDGSEVIFYAEVPADTAPEKVLLIDADTGRQAAELFDEADYEKYGDTIKGDSVYNCRFSVDTDINTDPEVSEDKRYHYYAMFEDEKGVHLSEPVEIWVLEQFTDSELSDMEEVDKVLAGMTNSDEFKALDTAQKQERAVEVLTELAEKGTQARPHSLIIKQSIASTDDVVSFQYACGVNGGVMLKEFGTKFN